MGATSIAYLPKTNQSQLFTMLLELMSDSYQESRIHSRKAILTLEYGEDPLPSRLDVQALISQTIKREMDQVKFLDVLERGPDDDSLRPFYETLQATKHSTPRSKRASTKKSPQQSIMKKPRSTSLNQSLASQGSVDHLKASDYGSVEQDINPAYGSVSPAKNQRSSTVLGEPRKSTAKSVTIVEEPKLQLPHKKQQPLRKMSVILRRQHEERITQLKAIASSRFRTGEEKRKSIETMQALLTNHRQLLIRDPETFNAVYTVILVPLRALGLEVLRVQPKPVKD